MINKDFLEFDKEKEIFYTNFRNSKTEDEKNNAKNKFKSELKVYLFEANKLIKDNFCVNISPYYETEGMNALYQKGATDIKYKKKDDYYKELDILKTSPVYKNCDENKKALIDNAIFILKMFYEDSLQ